MISAVQGFAKRHRRGLVITAGITGGIYLMGKYAKSKLIEFQEKTASERTAKEKYAPFTPLCFKKIAQHSPIMKRRFEQNQQDCVFTVLSLLPTLGDQLLHEMNVESITARLQQSRSQRSTPQQTPDSSVVLPEKVTETQAVAVNGDERKDDVKASAERDQESCENHDTNQSNSPIEFAAEDSSKQEEDTLKINGDSVAEGINSSSVEGTVTSTDAGNDDSHEDGDAPQIIVQSVVSTATLDTTEQEAKATQAAVRDEVAAAIDRRTKLELWNDIKIMSFTRTVTALYSLTFLTLLTQVQLNLLGRFTYVSSVVALSNSTDASYRMESPSTKGSLSSTNGILDFQTEKKYLTFSYWLLHEGWHRWSEKVREVVEDIVGGISLKKALSAKEFSDLVGQIRARL
ncbi:peroxin, partial [Mortierella sp. GBA30]